MIASAANAGHKKGAFDVILMADQCKNTELVSAAPG